MTESNQSPDYGRDCQGNTDGVADQTRLPDLLLFLHIAS